MAANINAIGMLMIAAATAFLLIRFREEPKGILPIAKAGILTLVAVSVMMSFSAHLCGAGQPTRQCFPTAVCLFLVLVFVHRRPVRGWAAVGILLLGFFLCQQFTSLVHTDTYTGNPGWAKWTCTVHRKWYLQFLRSSLTEVTKMCETAYPEGWLSESGVTALIPDVPEDLLRSRSVEVFHFWHTWMTGLHGSCYGHAEVWYPGGKLDDAIRKLEFRERHNASSDGRIR